MQIARVWTARTSPQNWDGYRHYFASKVVPELQQVAGYAGAHLLKHDGSNGVDLTVITFWESWEAISAFAGSDREAAVVTSEAAALLTEYDRRVRHCEVPFSDRFST